VLPFAKTGPVLPTLRWKTVEEVVQRANDSRTGLGAAVWSKDQSQAEEIARRLEIGSVWINSFEMPVAHAFFGGHKESGIGGEWGSDGWKAFCNVQVIHAPSPKL
jgi:acyl-CoA reductase-like NAD-dependent aldehyde dehydrogenase